MTMGIDTMAMDAMLIVVLNRYSIVNWNLAYVIDTIVMVSRYRASVNSFKKLFDKFETIRLDQII